MRSRPIVLVGVLTTSLSLGFADSVTFTKSNTLMAISVNALQGDRLPGLTCVQNALGVAGAVAGVSSLRITGDTKPAASSGARPLPGTREVTIVLPDRFRRVDVGRFRDGGSLPSTVGFDRAELLSSPRGEPAHTMRLARQEFIGEMLMRLPRSLPNVGLSERGVEDRGRPRLAIDASGPDGLRARLLAERSTCVPVAVEYEFPAGREVRIELSAWREFGGLRFATVLERSHNAAPFTVERVSSVEVNAPGADQYFPLDRSR